MTDGKVICDGCFRELESGDKYVVVRERLVGELIKKHTYGSCCADVHTHEVE